MTKLAVLTAVLLVSAVSISGAQQAAIPKPHPLPQSTTECRGCSDQHDSSKTSAGGYDEKKPGTVSPTVRPDVQPAKPVTKPHVVRKAKHKAVKKATTRETPPAAVRQKAVGVKTDTVKK